MRGLLVIDVQTSFIRRPSWDDVSAPDIADRVARLVDARRAVGDRIYWVLHSEPGTGGVFDPEVAELEFLPPLAVASGEKVVYKTSRNAFTTTNLQQLLTEDKVTELIICGIQTEQCCETTARVAADLGYRVTFVTEATATFPIPHRDAPKDRPWSDVVADPRTLGVAEIIERTEYALAGRFAELATLAELSA